MATKNLIIDEIREFWKILDELLKGGYKTRLEKKIFLIKVFSEIEKKLTGCSHHDVKLIKGQ
ncbi:MAG: hypothetical protein CM15mP58_19020 [Burkholderiaceae bacterium]|nr:MAG: hypothetical protein CM15mP58_19020 [Burkholderiaceae bacterium]